MFQILLISFKDFKCFQLQILNLTVWILRRITISRKFSHLWQNLYLVKSNSDTLKFSNLFRFSCFLKASAAFLLKNPIWWFLSDISVSRIELGLLQPLNQRKGGLVPQHSRGLRNTLVFFSDPFSFLQILSNFYSSRHQLVAL